ncbi:MAG: lipoyl(octanoyl) transferase LipB [Chthoniobacterales bacterium]
MKSFVNVLSLTPISSYESSWLGRMDYEDGLRLQEKLVAQKIAGDSKNYLLFLEHESVYTMGRRKDDSSLGKIALPHPVHRIGRGGEATYHGPGQLVCYPILDLSLFQRDLHAYLRFLEELLIQTLAHYNIVAVRREGLTGVWVQDRKIASLGIGVRKWISFHGLALNVSGDLSPFQKITPCGINGVTITSLEQEAQRGDFDFIPPSLKEVADQLADIFIRMIFNISIS